jgi:minor extracellular serine protease Vpr
MFNRSLMASSLLLTLTLTSCAPKHSGKGGFILSDYFSMRQQGVTPYVGLIQLQTRPLLADVKMLDGKAVIDEEAKKAILAEQEEVIARLQELSADIKIISTYKLVLNAVAFVATSDLSEKISKIQGVTKVVENSNFARPKTVSLEKRLSDLEISLPVKGINEHNTVTFIGADKVHRAGISGQNMKIGIIDTGIDYTHSMFGGPGTKDVYNAINPNVANDYFPNQKVVGGMDFVGTDFSAGDVDVAKNIPKRDPNPIDEAGHGSHVGGTVAGIGDGVKTYSGVAPEAKLYALKVFGKEGSTSEVAVIDALEYAADPSEKLDPSERLDVVNLSLGGGYGKPKVFYTEAIKNLTNGGTIVVASAGNSGDNPYIVGAPSTADAAISVAAAIDDMPQNITFPALALTIDGKETLLEVVEAMIGTSAVDSRVSGTPVYIGNGADPIAEDVKVAVSGKIALMDRGVITFADKLELALKLGATGVVVANNQEGNPFTMGGDKKIEIPAVMVSKAIGTQIKEALANKVEVTVNFSSGKIITRDDLIDTITDFSSRGPRSIDSLIKPEIAGPGSKVISAAVGSGTEGVQLNGTSMSGPHIAGVMALLKQANPTLNVAQLKAKVLNNSKIMMKDNVHVPVSLQGAGRVQVDRAFRSKVLAMPATLSLGEISVSSNKTIAKVVTVSNLSDKDIVFSSKAMSSKNIVVNLPGSFKVKANSSTKVTVSFTLLRSAEDKSNIESDGFVTLTSGDGTENINLPFLAIVNKVTDIIASDFLTMTNSKVDQMGAQVNLLLVNKGQNTGDALVFNLLGTDDRKVLTPPMNLSKSTTCDLEAAGIRVVTKSDAKGAERKMLQVGVKLYDALTQWQPCDISLQVDSNNDGIADLELLGIKAGYVSGITFDIFASLLLDAQSAREIRKNFELAPKEVKENYLPALRDVAEMKFYDHSDVAVIETDITKIVTDAKGNIGIKLAVSFLESDDNSDDFLGSHENKWQKINISENAFAFYDMPEVVTVNANDQETLAMKRGAGSARLLVLYPNNAGAMNDISKDKQSQILVEKLQK